MAGVGIGCYRSDLAKTSAGSIEDSRRLGEVHATPPCKDSAPPKYRLDGADAGTWPAQAAPGRLLDSALFDGHTALEPAGTGSPGDRSVAPRSLPVRCAGMAWESWRGLGMAVRENTKPRLLAWEAGNAASGAAGGGRPRGLPRCPCACSGSRERGKGRPLRWRSRIGLRAVVGRLEWKGGAPAVTGDWTGYCDMLAEPQGATSYGTAWCS